MFRAQVRRFVDAEIEPKVPEWNRVGMSDRASWRKMGAAGFLGANAPAEYGGGGVDFIYDAIVMEELSRVRAHGLMMSLHSDICMPYITSFGNEEQKRRYLPGAISGEIILAIAMTEPGTGSDLAAVQTTARRDGDHYVINGSKIFISNGQIADLVIVVCKTDPKANPPHKGISLMLVDASAPGFVRGRKLDKLGLRGQDTSELFFEDCRVPAGNLLGKEGTGFKMLMEKLQQERLCIGVVLDSELPAHARGHDRILQESARIRAADRGISKYPVQARRDDDRSGSGASLRRQAAGSACARRRDRRGSEHGKVVDDGLAEDDHQPMPAATRRLRLHDGVSGIDRLRGRGGAIDLRGHQRDHEGDHRASDGAGDKEVELRAANLSR